MGHRTSAGAWRSWQSPRSPRCVPSAGSSPERGSPTGGRAGTQPKGTTYPALPAIRAHQFHQIDYVGPCYLQRPVRFWSLNTVDVGTVDALWASWHRLGLPAAVQADNEMVFYGSPAHARGMGLLIRLCLPLGIEPWFIPFQEPWRNGVVERFNTHCRSKFLAWVQVPDFPGLRLASLAFEERHNSRYRYTRLHGQTPLAALASPATRSPSRRASARRRSHSRSQRPAATTWSGSSEATGTSTSSASGSWSRPRRSTRTWWRRSTSRASASQCGSTEISSPSDRIAFGEGTGLTGCPVERCRDTCQLGRSGCPVPRVGRIALGKFRRQCLGREGKMRNGAPLDRGAPLGSCYAAVLRTRSRVPVGPTRRLPNRGRTPRHQLPFRSPRECLHPNRQRRRSSGCTCPGPRWGR